MHLPGDPLCTIAGSAECSCATDNCSHRETARALRTRRLGIASTQCGLRTRCESGAAWLEPDWARSAPNRTTNTRGCNGSVHPATPGGAWFPHLRSRDSEFSETYSVPLGKECICHRIRNG